MKMSDKIVLQNGMKCCAFIALFFFACPKKNEKKTPTNDIQHIRGIRLD
jgi:hypothetical protein